ncbi:MAG: GNAT family N-acetyltransferase [Anaerolineales bacterium]|jgi:GNAT superfamily N-acetyltransferase
MTTIERASLTDQEAILELLQKQFVEHEIEYSSDILSTAIGEMLKREGLGLFLVARDKDKLIGIAAISFAWTLEHGGKSAWLDELYVLPDYREDGIGSALIESAIDELRKQGCAAIDLEVEENHHRAERLYERKGFKRLKRKRWVKQIAQSL